MLRVSSFASFGHFLLTSALSGQAIRLSGGTPLRLTVLSTGARVEFDYRVSASGLAVFCRLLR